MKSSFSSWEELAFAEDTAGNLGGCVWPPRSYSCSFCRREFRSAQALGGHMNVHRRDRARLKQSSQVTISPPRNLSTTSSDDAPPIFSPLYNSPNPEFIGHLPLVSSHVIRVSRSPNTPSLCFEKKRKDHVIVPSQPYSSWSTSLGDHHVLGLVKGNHDKKSAVLDQPDSGYRLERERDDYATKGLSVNLDLAVCHTNESNHMSNDEEVASCKRRRVEAKPPSTIFQKTTSALIETRCLPQSEVFKSCSGAAEELDLELRLGDAPKVK